MSYPPRKLLLGAMALFVLSSAIRIGAIPGQVGASGLQRHHGAEMLFAAEHLAQTGEIADVFGPNTGPSAHVAPLYPVCLAVVFRATGTERGGSALPQFLWSILGTALGIALLPFFAQRAGLSLPAGYAAALVMALSPFNFWTESYGAWEAPYCVPFILALCLAFIALHDCRWQSWTRTCLTGLLLGVGMLLSPAVLAGVVLMWLGELLVAAAKPRRLIASGVVITTLCLACLSPWMWRNYRALGGFVPVRSNFGLELWVGNNPWANGKSFGTTVSDPNHLLMRIHPFANDAERKRLKELGELAYMREKEAMALQWIEQHPREFIGLCFRRLQIFWFPPEDMWDPCTGWRRLRPWFFSLVSVGAIAGLLRLFWIRHPYRWLLFGSLVGPTLAYLITHVDMRYRYPIIGLSVLLGCDCVVQLGSAAAARFRARGLRTALAGAIVVPRPTH